MIVTLLMIAGILFLALQLEDKLGIPSPLGLIALSFLAHFGIQQVPVQTGDAEHFATLVVFLLPILLISDSLEIKVADMKEHGLSLLYLAVVAVVLSVLMALFVSNWLFADITLSSAAVIVLFAMVLATDPVSVVSIFSKFDLPHRLKILAEGESLFNDATALIVFVFVGLYALGGGVLTAGYVAEISAEVVFGSVAVGIVTGYIGLYLMKTTDNRIAEMMVLIITGYGAFWLSEHFFVLLNLLGEHSHLHLSGILSCIFATITVHHVMTRDIAEEDSQIDLDETELHREARKRDTSSGLVGNMLKHAKERRDPSEGYRGDFRHPDRTYRIDGAQIRAHICHSAVSVFLPAAHSRFFPETREMGSKLLDYLITPFATFFHTIIKYVPNFFYIFVITVIARYVLKVISYVFKLIGRGELKFDWFYDDWARPTYQIVRFLVIVTALISAYPYIPGSSSQAFQGVGLVLGAIISFASSSAISNIVAGIILTYTRAFRLGDRIKVGETTGDVVEKTLLVTRVETIKSEIVTIPNSLVMGAQLTNFSTSADEGEGVILYTTVTIGYDVPWKQVRDLRVEAAKETKNILDNPEPYVLQTALGDFYISYQINAYTRQPKYMPFTYSELHKNILDKFDAAGVEIMSPHYYALRDGNASAVPSVLNAKGYVAPAFKVGKAEE